MTTPTPRPIRLLDDVTASRIAAGEVVERPASVAKELLENSIDAGAADIHLEIAQGGRRTIRVVDDGRGIAADQVRLAIARHATSKIESAADLDDVRTLGFRGEALAAIAAVSHLTLVTRARDSDAGVELRVDNGRVVSEREVGAPPGTSVTVENLFGAVPARLKFLRTDQTEAGHVATLVTRYALAHPSLRLCLVRDGKTVFRSSGTGRMADVLAAAYGTDTARKMLVVGGERPGTLAAEDRSGPGVVLVDGYASPPHVHRATRRDITLFVNGRPVQDPQLTYAVIQAYHTLLPAKRYPIAVLTVTIAPAQVDVNVHPAKTEVRFRNARAVFGAVQRAVHGAVTGAAPVAPIGDAGRRPSVGQAGGRSWPGYGTPTAAVTEPPERGAFGASAGPTATPGLPVLRVLGQVALSYIVAEGPDGLYLIDQHAAHERVMYEELTAREGVRPRQQLLEPVAVRLNPTQMGTLSEAGPSLSALGFEIEPFGSDTVLVRGVPEVLAGPDVAPTLASVLDLTEEGAAPVDEALEARIVRAVCKRATVKAGQALTPEEMRALVRRLEATSSPRTCPHGRPTMIVLETARLAREFGRC